MYLMVKAKLEVLLHPDKTREMFSQHWIREGHYFLTWNANPRSLPAFMWTKVRWFTRIGGIWKELCYSLLPLDDSLSVRFCFESVGVFSEINGGLLLCSIYIWIDAVLLLQMPLCIVCRTQYQQSKCADLFPNSVSKLTTCQQSVILLDIL